MGKVFLTLPVNRTDTAENIPFPSTPYVIGNKDIIFTAENHIEKSNTLRNKNAFQSKVYHLRNTFTVDRKLISFYLTLTLSNLNLDLRWP